MLENIQIIGTSHIAKDSVMRIKDEFESFKPDIIAVELDAKRYRSIMQGNQQGKLNLSIIRKVGVGGFLFLIIGRYLQKKLGSIVGIEPGSDMKQAIIIARENSKELQLIDQDIEITLKNFSKRFSFKEKVRLAKDLLFGLFGVGDKIKFDISSVPKENLVFSLIEQLKKRYPGIYFALVEDRNRYMSKRLFFISSKNPSKKILCVVGAGHKAGINEKLKSLYYSNTSRS